MIRSAAVLVLTLASFALFAASVSDQLSKHVAAGQLQQAYELGLSALDSEAGTPDFDLPFGIAAIDTGHINEGVFALERVLFLQPNNHRARLEYARGLFMLGEDAQARQQFTRVLEQGEPPPAVHQNITMFLDAIRRREGGGQSAAKGYVGLSYGYDDNINGAPDDQLTLITLSQDSLSQGDQYANVNFGGQLFIPLSKRSKLYGRWDSLLRVHQDAHDQDNANHSLTLGGQWNLQQNLFDLGFNVQQYLLDNSRYRTLYGPTAQWTRSLDTGLTLQTSLSWLLLDHTDLSFRDSRQGLANLRLFGNLDLPMSPSWFTGAFYGDERSDAQSLISRASVDREFAGLQLGGQLNLQQDLGFGGSLTYQGSHYAGDDWLYGVARKDNYYGINIELKKLLSQYWQLSLEASFNSNDSNIELYDYQRQQLELGVRYDF